VTKLAAEHLCRLYHANYHLDAVCLRYFSVYGPRQRPDMAFATFCEKTINREPITIFGDGSQTRDFTYVDDVVRGILAAADRGEALGLVRDAIALARARGAEVVGLGGQISVVTGAGLDLGDLGVPLTTGNAYTALSAVDAAAQAAAAAGVEPERATAAVLGAAHRMLESTTEFPSREAALASLRSTRPRDREEARRHRVEHNMVDTREGVAFKYDKVRVAIGLAHMADDLRKYAARTTCPVAIIRGTVSSELSAAQAREIAACWARGFVVEVEGDYALQMENAGGLAQALIAFASQTAKA
jgi:nucleoside-diphosphate-sugar epimerase